MNHYHLLLTLHLASMTAWMAAMFYLPRLFAYHADAPVGGPVSEQFKIMERRLLKAIMTPAMVATWVFGLSLAITGDWLTPGPGHAWLHAKLLLVLGLSGLHGFFAATTKKFARDERGKSARFYKIINELVTMIFLGIVALAVFKPF